MTFDAAAYTPGETVTLTVDYTPDAPSVTSQTFTVTASVHDASGNVLNSATAPLVVNTPQPSGNKVGVTDDGGHTWVPGTDTGTVAMFSTTV